MTFPEPDCAFGYTDEQVQDVMRADLAAYRSWAIGETMTVCTGEPWCTVSPDTAPHGTVHHERHVVRFKRAGVHERRDSMTDILASWDLDGALPGENSMSVVRQYAAGELSLDEAIKEMRNLPGRDS